MAGNNSLQMLRGTSSAISASTATLLAGQPLYDMTNNLLYVGDGSTTQINSTTPIYAYGLKDNSGSLLVYENIMNITLGKRLQTSYPISVGPTMGAVEITGTGIGQNWSTSTLNFTSGSGCVHISAYGGYNSIKLNLNEISLDTDNSAGISLNPGIGGITLGGSTIHLSSILSTIDSSGTIKLLSQTANPSMYSYAKLSTSDFQVTVRSSDDYTNQAEFYVGPGEVEITAGSTLTIYTDDMFIEAKGYTYELPSQGGKFAMVSNYSNGDLYLVG